MELHETGRKILDDSDDQSFCELTLYLCQVGDNADDGVTTLYQPFVLQRLREIKRRAPHIYYGSFLGPLRRQFRGVVVPQDLHEAMATIDAAIEDIHGDVTPGAFTEAAMEYYHIGSPVGASPGWSNVAQHYTIRPGEMTVITGIASNLKSTWLQALCLNLARHHNWKIGIFSPEHAPLGELARMLVEVYNDTPLSQTPREMLADTFPWVADHFHPMAAIEDFPPSLAWILAVARQQVKHYGIHGLVIDPWNEVAHEFGRQSETNYISDCLSRLRRFARQYQVHVWLVVHPTKMQKAVGGEYAGKYPPPTPYDCAGSAHWLNKADNCLCIWRDVEEDSAQIQVHIQKIRYRAVGRIGRVYLTYTGRQFIEEEVKESAWSH